MNPTLRLLTLALLLPLLASSPARGEESPGSAFADALAAGKKVRASLPVPTEKHEFVFEGDIQIAGEEAGSVRYSAEPTDHEGKKAWLATEDSAQNFGGSRTRGSSTLVLAQDLSLLSGEIEQRTPEGVVRTRLTRTKDGFDVEVEKEADHGDPTKLKLPAPEGATFGKVALLLFSRATSKNAPATYALPWFSPEDALRPRDDHSPAPTTDPAVLQVRGEDKFGEGAAAKETWVVEFKHGQRAYDLHLSPKDRALHAIFGRVPPVNVVPTGTAGARTETDDDKPAKTWKAAFLKFGHGYHMANKAWLEAAFHWPSFYEFETSGEKPSWSKSKPVEEFKAAWIEEFIGMSKHRSRLEADQLLGMTLATGKVVEQSDDHVVFAAHPEFGGGVQRTYHLKKIDGIWYLTRIDM